MSSVEIVVTLFFDKMHVDPTDPKMTDRDRFVLSKGHAAPCYYGVLAERGFFDRSAFKSFRQINGILQGHPDVLKCPGVDASTGSLGQGISIAVGMALGARLSGNGARVYTLLGDGELQEGQVWEAAMAAAHYKLDNLTVIIDHNGLQIDGSNDQVMSLGNIKDKFTAFGFEVMPDAFPPIAIFIKAPGAFLVLMIIVMIMNAVHINTRANKVVEGCDGCCASCAKSCKDKEERQ